MKTVTYKLHFGSSFLLVCYLFSVLFGDHEVAEQILLATKPMAMKALGRQVRNFDEEVWKQNRRQIVKKGNLAKVKTLDTLYLMRKAIYCKIFYQLL